MADTPPLPQNEPPSPPPPSTVGGPPKGLCLLGKLKMPSLTVETAKPLLLVGLLLVLVARGCDSLATRKAARAGTWAQAAVARFQDRWAAKAYKAQKAIDALNAKAEKTEADNKQLAKLNKEFQDLGTQQAKERKDLENTDWRELAADARAARNGLASGSYEFFFLLGTIILAIALVTIGFRSTGPERVVALIMITIITFSIYVGGIAWISSVMGVLK